MGIVIIFMILSVILIIGTSIYVKKNNRFYNFKAQEKTNLKKQKKNIKNIWGIEEIKDGVITVQGQHSIIIELGSIEYRLLNEKEQESIDNALINISKTMTYNMQFFSSIVKVDTSKKIEEIRENIEKQKNSKLIEYGESIIQYLTNIMHEDDLYVRKNYLIISSFETREKATVNLEEFYHNLKYSLTNINVTAKMLSDAGIIELLHRELNKNSEENIESIIREGGLDFYVQSKFENKEKRTENITEKQEIQQG